MNLILHQFKTDVRHFRWRLAVLWLSFAAGPGLNALHSLSGTGLGISSFLLDLWQAFFALAIVTALVQADPLVGDGAAWLVRPLRRAHLFWAKSAFIILCLFLPWLAMRSLAWSMRGYTWHLGWLAAEEASLYGVACVLVVAVLAALTRSFTRFFLAAGITIGGIFASALVVETLVHMGGLHQSPGSGQYGSEREASALTVCWLVLAGSALAAWLWQVRAGRWQMAVFWLAGGLLVFPVIHTVWFKNFLAPQLTSSAPLTLSLTGTNRPAGAPGQWLSSELLLAGVPAGQVAVVQNVSAAVLFKGDRHYTSLLPVSPNTSSGRIRPQASSPGEYFRVIQGFFPSNTIWFNGNFNDWISSAFDRQFNDRRFHGHPPMVKINGSVTVDLFGLKKVAEAPLQPAIFQALPGLRVTIQKVSLVNGVISLSLDECSARLMFNRDANMAGQDDFNGNSFCTYILYHPGSAEACVVSQGNIREDFPSLLSGETHLGLQLKFPYPALRERLAGISAADWLHEARLCIFVPVYAGTSQLAFQQDDYHWPENFDGDIRRQKENFADVQAIEHATLPAHYTAAQLDVYLDTILLNVPDSWDHALSQTIQKKLTAVGTNGLPALIRRLPLESNLENQAFPVIRQLITRDQLPDLRAALQRDSHVVDLFVQKHWEAEARDILLAKLPDHRQPLTPAALRLAAEAQSPPTYADLRWHFVHLEYGQDEVIGALEQCPGFDAAGTVREAWQNARLGVTGTDGLAATAARQGLPDALNLAVVQATENGDPNAKEQELAQLAPLVSYAGPTNHFLPWLTANLAGFRYDSTRQRYTLESVP